MANSLDSNGKNVGCPAKENEVEVFVKVLRQTSNLTDEEIMVIEKRFLEPNKTQG